MLWVYVILVAHHALVDKATIALWVGEGRRVDKGRGGEGRERGGRRIGGGGRMRGDHIANDRKQSQPSRLALG